MSATDKFPVKLVKNYQPLADYEIVGYHRPEREMKGSDGKMFVAEPAAFIPGEMSPPPFPGTGFPGKVWANTVIALPKDEAKTVVQKRLAEITADAIG